MTDQNEAPEQIWAWKWNTPGLKEHNKPAWCAFEPTFKPWRVRDLPTKEHWFGKLVEYGQTTQEYTRADISDAKDKRIAELEDNLAKAEAWVNAALTVSPNIDLDIEAHARTTLAELKGPTQ